MRAHELGRFADGRPFLTMKLSRGRTLSELLRERASPAEDLDRNLTILEQVAQTINFAHIKHIVLRYLKPGNMMVWPSGNVQVMDCGRAKVLGPATEAAGDATCLTADSVSLSTERGDPYSLATPLKSPKRSPLIARA